MKSRLEQVVAILKEKYGVDVSLSDVSTGSYVDIAKLSGKRIIANTNSRDPLGILFIVSHLFGHMVQFSNYEKYKALVEATEKPKPLTLSDEFKDAFFQYEVEAYEIGKGLLQEAVGRNQASALDEKYQIYLHTDFEIFWDYITSGKQISIAEFNQVLQENYVRRKGRYPVPLRGAKLPETVSPQKDAIVY